MTLLDRVLELDNLAEAWLRVADNRGAPGADDVSVRRFARNWEENLRRIRDRVREGQYRPAKLRRTAIPKPAGGQRLLSIPVVADRVLQRAVLNVVDGLFERRFLDCSYGYRRGRGLRQAVAALLRYRDRGRTWVLDADIDDCFNSLDHGLLSRFLAEEIDDPAVMGLMRAWLELGRSAVDPDRGIALGMPISPLWCNVTLHRLDAELARLRWAMVRYADDFVVCCAGRKQAEHALRVVADLLAGLRLRLEPAKTRITSFDETFWASASTATPIPSCGKARRSKWPARCRAGCGAICRRATGESAVHRRPAAGRCPGAACALGDEKKREPCRPYT